ncbi:MAG: hypothetical protein IJU87_03775 [Lachnospiraceae bacterium]|nr:hypothetical protein [Lachnospiraceae bacterium]
MHISFQTETQSTAKENNRIAENPRMMKAYGADNAGRIKDNGIVMDIGEGKNAAHGFKGVGKQKGIKAEKSGLADDINSFDAKNAHNYMAVMSNTMSDKDFRAMKEEGYHPGRMNSAEAVTGLDRIKVILARSGVNVAGFTDTVDRETAAKITGSVAAANAITDNTPVSSEILKDEEALQDFIASGLESADLPVTDANIRDAVQAFDTAAKTEMPDQGSIEYMLSNGAEPTVENVYLAEHSGSGEGSGGARGYFDNEGTGYMAEIAESDDLKALSESIDSIIGESGLKADDEIKKDAEYLIREGFALNPETLNLYEDLKNLSFPLKAGDLMEEISSALSRGESAGNAYLIKGYSRTKNERVLNETRLRMNIEANRSLEADNGFTLDTEELSERVDELKIKERAFYHALFMKDGGNDKLTVEESISLAEETLFKTAEIRNMPAAVIGGFSSAEAFTVNDVYEAGNRLRSRFEAAGQTYEAVGTEVRADLGDRIGDAFRNAGELLHELGIKETEENLRAVRILGYNSMEITEGNISAVKNADQTVRTLINRLTGAAAVSLIREGVNPLKTDMQELIDRISDMQGLEGENEKFSEYLFKLERNNEISDDEAESYIGIFRLLRQIENSDGAVIGSLLQSGKELSLKNLLTELRIRGRGHMDFSVDNDFGGLTASEDASRNLKIDAQIGTAFRNEGDEGRGTEQQYRQNLLHELYDSLSPEKLMGAPLSDEETTLEDILDIVRRSDSHSGERKAENVNIETGPSAEEELSAAEAEEIRAAAEKDDKVYEMLLRYGQEITPENVIAMDSLMNDRGAFLNELMALLGGNIRESIKRRSEKLLEKMDEDRAESGDTGDALKEAYGEMTEEMEELIRDASVNAESYVDLKSLQSLNRRLTVAKALSREENYEIPMESDGRFFSVNLKIVRGTGESKAAISFETEELGQVYAEFTLSKDAVKGIASSSIESGRERLSAVSERFFAALDEAGIRREGIFFEKSLSRDINRIPETADITSIGSRNQAPSGTDGGSGGSESMDAGNSPAVLYRTAKIFLTEVFYAHQQ